jgi:predicted RNase H-like HicB family nuclease
VEILNLQPRGSLGEIILYRSEEDQAFVAEVPELPGCAADGATRQETLANAEAAIAAWVETAPDLGRAIPEAPVRAAVYLVRRTGHRFR